MDKVVAVLGMGYVGLPVAISFSEKYKVIGFDISKSRLSELQSGYDRTKEISSKDLQNSKINFTNKVSDLAHANFFIITVPTPIDEYNQPDFTALRKSSEFVGSVLKEGDVVVYESTVYPGATEEICLPILENCSQLKLGSFGLGYSPERINPADRNHTFKKIQKVVSGNNLEVLEQISQVYGSIIEAPIHKAPTIKVAEAAKVIENIQRDVNIALMNELSILFDRLSIDTLDVLEAAETKWNFLPFRPGLVGGHCIGVDPYYLTYKAESVGYYPQVILSGRRINNHIPNFIVTRMIQEMIAADQNINQARVLVVGISFKENCPDIRNSKTVDIINEFKKYGVQFDIYDPVVRPDDVWAEYNLSLTDRDVLEPVEAIIFAVSHDEVKSQSEQLVRQLLKPGGCVIDVKGIINPSLVFEKSGRFWRL